MPPLKPPRSAAPNRILVKLRPTAPLAAAEARANLRPLYTSRVPGFRLGLDPQWFVADLPDGAETPWDLVHTRVADRLGMAESDILLAEPDLIHDIYPYQEEPEPGQRFTVGAKCAKRQEQEKKGGKETGTGFAWHLEDKYSQLRTARADVPFEEPRTRIAHIDTGYWPEHVTVPAQLQSDLARSFVARDDDPDNAGAPRRQHLLFDSSGHGTGTLGILAGSVPRSYSDEPLGGAPEAEIVPLRVASRVVLLRTSAFAEALLYAVDHDCDVVSMSMGGLPSNAWRDAIDRAYLAGVCVVTAAGNHYSGFPPRFIVYPARYARVIAACGVMANHAPYFGLKRGTMQGNHGPDSVMGSALGAYTPNIPWPVFGCTETLRLNGEGTSAATPQIAAAAALWLEKYKAQLPDGYERVEAVRHALFTAARKDHPRQLGNGILQAKAALAVRPVLGLKQAPRDRHAFAALRILTGLGIDGAAPREAMLDLELIQRWLVNEHLQEILPDPEEANTAGRLNRARLTKFMDALIEDPGASLALRRQVAARYPIVTGRKGPRTAPPPEVVPPTLPAAESPPEPADPPHRRLRVYALDPTLSGRLGTADVAVATLHVRWEVLKPGPVGEYIEVSDRDAFGRTYSGVDLEDGRLLACDGWAPAEGNPQFHQQMVYAVVMKTTEHFERALGRPVLWRHARNASDASDESRFARRLVIRPHAVRQANAFYSPQRVALEFGYFEAMPEDARELVPGSRVYTCLSHDIIAHEATHAILDGMHRHFTSPTNPDVLAFHEGFADIVALMQHFAMPELLRAEISRARGDLEAETLLGGLAVQFAQASGRGGALREAIGQREDGKWRRLAQDPEELQRLHAPHSRGAILVAAVFDALLAIYRNRTADLVRIATSGTGVLPSGALHPDLVNRLADEAACSANHVLTMCIRALDYLPPVDVTFFEYLRALITADHDLVRDDRLAYRVAFVEAFRRRGIVPHELGDDASADTPRSISVEALRWRGVDLSKLSKDERDTVSAHYDDLVKLLREYAHACFYIQDREALFTKTHETRRELAVLLEQALRSSAAFAEELGVDPGEPFVVDELRRAMRVRHDGCHVPQVVVSLTQEVTEKVDGEAFTFQGGSTLVVDLAEPAVKYRIVKNIHSAHRRKRTLAFARRLEAEPLHALLLGGAGSEPFAMLHSLAQSKM